MNELGPILTNLVNLTLSGGIFPSSFKQALVQPLLKKPSLSTYPLIHLYPLMIATTFVQFQTATSFPKCSKKSLPPTFNLTCPLTLCLFLNLLTGSFILLKLLFLKFTMTSPLQWIVVRSLAFFLTYLQPLILSIIPSFSLVFTIGSVLMAFHLIGPHLISHLVLRQSQSMIPSLHSLLFPVVYPRFRSSPTAFYSRYYSSWFDDLKKFPKILISFVR